MSNAKRVSLALDQNIYFNNKRRQSQAGTDSKEPPSPSRRRVSDFQEESTISGLATQLPVQLRQKLKDTAPGLDCLILCDQLIVQPTAEKLAAFSRVRTEKRYTIASRLGHQWFYAAEVPKCLEQLFCGARRSLNVRLVDTLAKRVVQLRRPTIRRGLGCLGSSMQQVLEVSAPPGVLLGRVEQTHTLPRYRYAVMDPDGDVLMRIEGPATNVFPKNVEFKIMTADRSQLIGVMVKKWPGFLRDAFTEDAAVEFSVSFPQNLDLDLKTMLLGGCIFIVITFDALVPLATTVFTYNPTC